MELVVKALEIILIREGLIKEGELQTEVNRLIEEANQIREAYYTNIM